MPRWPRSWTRWGSAVDRGLDTPRGRADRRQAAGGRIRPVGVAAPRLAAAPSALIAAQARGNLDQGIGVASASGSRKPLAVPRSRPAGNGGRPLGGGRVIGHPRDLSCRLVANPNPHRQGGALQGAVSLAFTGFCRGRAGHGMGRGLGWLKRAGKKGGCRGGLGGDVWG